MLLRVSTMLAKIVYLFIVTVSYKPVFVVVVTSAMGL